jgi:hypothetical protein
VFGAELRNVRGSGRRISSIEVGPGDDPGTPTTIVDGGVWIDATYEGDLLAAAGASWALGREPQSLHGERWAGRHEILPNPHQVRAPVAARDDDGALLPWVVHYDDIGRPGDGDGKVQSSCFRLCLSRAPDRIPLGRPADYDRERYVLVDRYLRSLVRGGLRPEMHDVLGISDLPNDKVDVNSHGPFSMNLLGAAWGYATADRADRHRIVAEHQSWAAGLLYFLATDAAVPGEIHDLLSPYGLAPDEFVDTGHWPHQLYVREARRLVGEHVLVEDDVLGGSIPGDTIAMAGYNIDIREIQWVACPIPRFPNLEDEVLVEGYLSVPVPPYGVPYRSLLPRPDELANLLVSTCISASAVAFASVRMEPQYLAIGHATGAAAAQASRRNVSVHDVDVAALRADLERSGQVLRAR